MRITSCVGIGLESVCGGAQEFRDGCQVGLAAAAVRKPTVRLTIRERLSRYRAFSGKFVRITTGTSRICNVLPLASHASFLGKFSIIPL